MSDRPDLRILHGTCSVAVAETPVIDAFSYQAGCVGGWVASMVARGFSPTTIESDNAMLDRFLDLAGKPAWELTPADVDGVVAVMAQRGTGPVTRRDYVSTFHQFFEYLQARHAIDIERRFGVRLADPIDRFHAGRHVTKGPASRTPPTVARMEEFFSFLRAGWT